MPNQRICAATVALATIALAACGADDPDRTTAGPATDASFCDQVDGIEQTYELITAMDELEPTDLAARVDTATSMFDAVEAPEEIAKDWGETSRFLQLLDDAFAGKDPADEQDMATISDEKGEQILGALMSVQSSAENVGRYVQSECGVDLGVSESAAVSDACALLEDGDIAEVFDGSVPKPESRPYGGGTAECIWERQEREVSIVLMPAKTLRKEYVSKSTPLDVPVTGVRGGHAYMGVFGIGRFSTDGHTVSFRAGKTGGLVSVTLGSDGDQQAEIGLAIELAGVVTGRLAS